MSVLSGPRARLCCCPLSLRPTERRGSFHLPCCVVAKVSIEAIVASSMYPTPLLSLIPEKGVLRSILHEVLLRPSRGNLRHPVGAAPRVTGLCSG